jgi:hypothetical protein
VQLELGIYIVVIEYNRIWTRRVCINQNLELGSMIPFLEFAKTNGFSCIVLNPNLSKDPITNEQIQ